MTPDPTPDAKPSTPQPAAAPAGDPAAGVPQPDGSALPEPPRSSLNHLVVGLGASAGGLQALTRFFEHMPARNGMAFVVVIHLSPAHESHVASILQRITRMPVQQVQGPVAIEPDHVYVIPPGRSLSMVDGSLVLQDEERVEGRNVAIDTFFRVLAQVHGSRSVSVVLSGTGTDGSVGLMRIKEQGGVTLAQDPDDAQHDGMPRAAIATGMVDFVLPVTEMPARLVQLAANARVISLPRDVAPELNVRATDPGVAGQQQETALAEIMTLLRTRTRHDFRHYKRPTVLRRLERRMQVTGTNTLAAYRDHLQAHQEETAPLLQDMLISVTNFFRDREAFEALERDALPPLLARLGSERGLRAWVVGCATGEEAYSLAMLLQEARDLLPDTPQFQVFATDIDERALAVARTGLYPGSIITDVTPTRVRNFFTPQQDHCRVQRSLRERVLFAHHNVLRDPPFSRVDLILCRNLLIYLDARAQASVLDIFRFALNPGGVLFLGSSETADSASSHFAVFDKRHRLYRLRPSAQVHRSPTLPAEGALLAPRGTPVLPAGPASRTQRFTALHQSAREAAAPPSVLVDAEHKILHMAGEVSRYLQVGGGVPSPLLLDNTHPDLRLALRTALFKMRAPGGAAAQPGSVEAQLDTQRVRLHVQPVRDTVEETDLLLVSFEDLGQRLPPAPEHAAGTPAEQVVRELVDENRRLEQQLQGVIEHSEASTEELVSSNEELQAVNEELRSASEELETSREELQSTNEELVTVNGELAGKVEETSRINDDLQNLINSNDIATVFVDRSMRIKRYTPRACDLFNLIPADVGRSLTDITHRLQYPELVQDTDTAFRTLRLVEREVQGEAGRHYMARLQPYRTAEDRIDGAIMNFVDVTSLRRAQEEAQAGAEQLRLAAESTRDFAILTTDDNGLVTAWNAGAEKLFGYGAAEMLGQPVDRLYTDEDRAAGAPQQERDKARVEGRHEDERWHRRRDGSVFFCSGVTTRLEGGRGFAKIARDLTGHQRSAQQRAEQLLRARAGRREAETMMEAKEMFLAVMSHELKHPLNLIHLNAELLARLPEIRHVAAAARAAQVIQRTVAGQAKIIDDLLDLSRARTGKLTLDTSPVDWAETLRRIVDASRVEAEGLGVQLQLALCEEPVLSLFDPVRADQVVWNLLGNALKFTPRGGTVTVRLSVEGEDARITVTDTGRGIDPAYLDQVFNMFSQEPGPHRREQTGMGIGLALVRELVQAQGGRVQAQSEGPGRGAQFSVWLPRHQGAAPAPAAADAPSVLKGMNLLVVDDSPDSVEALTLLLGMTGASVTGAVCAADALALLDKNRYDLLVSDIGMPGMSGHELIAAVRARERGGHRMLALACSGYGRAQDQRHAIEVGFDALIAKPASLEQVEQAVAALLAARAEGAAPASAGGTPAGADSAQS